MSPITEINTFGDARRFILNTMIELRDGKMDISRGMAIAANMKVLNDNIQCEINIAKVAISAKEKGHDFGRVVHMGTALIGPLEEEEQ